MEKAKVEGDQNESQFYRQHFPLHKDLAATKAVMTLFQGGTKTLDSCYVTILIVPGQCRSSHVSLYTDGHGDASTADVAQLL